MSEPVSSREYLAREFEKVAMPDIARAIRVLTPTTIDWTLVPVAAIDAAIASTREECALVLLDMAECCESAEQIGANPARAEAFRYAAAAIRSLGGTDG